MIISNFRNLTIKNNIAYAEVDVTEYFWIWKKTKTETVFNKVVINNTIRGCWRWINTGDFTPRDDVENLCAKYQAEQILNAK